jgi:hypothetical protein
MDTHFRLTLALLRVARAVAGPGRAKLPYVWRGDGRPDAAAGLAGLRVP